MKRKLLVPIKVSKLLSSCLILSLFSFISTSSHALDREKCSQIYQSKVNELLNEKNSSAKDLAEKVLGQSFQKLAYAHNIFADGSPEELKELEQKVDKYIKENLKYSMPASDVMKELKEFSAPFQQSTNNGQSTTSAVKVATKRKLEALVLFSKSLDNKKFHIEDYEKDALSKFNFRSHKKNVDGWGLFVGDIARNFYQRRFYDRDDNKVDTDKNFSRKKISVYNSDVKEAIKNLKDDILAMAKNMSKECHQFLRQSGDNSGMCKLLNPFDAPSKDLILNAETILSKMQSPDATFIKNPISVHYAGAQFSVPKCKITADPNEEGMYTIEMDMDFKYIPGADNEDWSMTLFGSHKREIINNENYDEDIRSNKTFSTFSEKVTYNKVPLTPEQLNLPLTFDFSNKSGGQVKMFTIGSPGYERDLNGDGSRYNINCNPPQVEKSSPPPAPLKKVKYAFTAKNEANTISLELFRDDEKANFSSDELKGSKVQWTLPEGLSCAEADEDNYKLTCKITEDINEIAKASYELIDHNIQPDKADAPMPGEVELVVKTRAPRAIRVTATNDIEKMKTTLSSEVAGFATEPEIKWELKIDGTPKEMTGDTVEVGLFKVVDYKACAINTCTSGKVSNKITVRVRPDGTNNTTDEAVKLRAVLSGPFKDIKGSYTWLCDGKACSGAGDKLELKRTDKNQNIIAKFKAADKEFASGGYDVSRLEKEEKKEKDEEECEEDEENSDPFSAKKKTNCKPKEESQSFAPKYMPPMQQPLILPPSQPYISPGFN